MPRFWCVCLSSCVLALSLVGCGGPGSVKVTPPAAPPPLKAKLLDVANSGELGSGTEGIRDEIKTLEPAKAEELTKDWDELEKMNDPARIKAKAKAMADKI